MLQLTHRQKDIYEFIREFQDEHKYPPIFRQIAQAQGISVGAVQWHINAIEKKGRLKRIPNEARTIQLIGD